MHIRLRQTTRKRLVALFNERFNSALTAFDERRADVALKASSSRLFASVPMMPVGANQRSDNFAEQRTGQRRADATAPGGAVIAACVRRVARFGSAPCSARLAGCAKPQPCSKQLATSARTTRS